MSLASADLEEGRPSSAESSARIVATGQKKSGQKDTAALAFSILSHSLVVQGRHRESLIAIREAESLCRKSQDTATRFNVALEKGRSLLGADRRREAKTVLAFLESQAAHAGMAPVALEASLLLGDAETEPAAARRAWTRVKEGSEKLGIKTLSKAAATRLARQT